MTPDRGSQMETQELLLCPFCGGGARFYPAQVLIDGKCPESIACSNEDCDIHPSTDYLPVADAITAWNTRAQSAQIATLQAEVDRLRAGSIPEPTCPNIDIAIAALEQVRSDNSQMRYGYWHMQLERDDALARAEAAAQKDSA